MQLGPGARMLEYTSPSEQPDSWVLGDVDMPLWPDELQLGLVAKSLQRRPSELGVRQAINTDALKSALMRRRVSAFQSESSQQSQQSTAAAARSHCPLSKSPSQEMKQCYDDDFDEEEERYIREHPRRYSETNLRQAINLDGLQKAALRRLRVKSYSSEPEHSFSNR
eukprot:TRINITY_DN28372_c0_g1_i1.p1 TRINITY_DN28372_c0_g1~~TRINITY_DN28372_c0_g1_i1.p1  ORF type:complete len:187 (-),score=40.36 TRINITY_DN28372_c0_g1_i1:36-536(-)